METKEISIIELEIKIARLVYVDLNIHMYMCKYIPVEYTKLDFNHWMLNSHLNNFPIFFLAYFINVHQ